MNMISEQVKEFGSEVYECFVPEKDNPYPLCVGRGMAICKECQVRADWEPKSLYGTER